MDNMLKLRVRYCVKDIVENYITSFKKKELLLEFETYKKFMNENIEEYNISASDNETIATTPISDSERLSELETLSSYQALTANKKYNLMMDLQENYFDVLTNRFVIDIETKFEHSDHGVQLNVAIKHKDIYNTALALRGDYRLPYVKNKLVHDSCLICLEEFVEKSFVRVVVASMWYDYNYEANLRSNGTTDVEIQMSTVPLTGRGVVWMKNADDKRDNTYLRVFLVARKIEKSIKLLILKVVQIEKIISNKESIQQNKIT
ncbi:hypothetical protein HELRODRAFT_183535 [Helobdella robusta]|uniref:Uncharacterized protein n=1 Tax=Helobdella robusta TaxID=6412 RepID=T1FJT2_HELRO|nr:hypothetical protein HELRODRAFT_183535 [Helobdella robusta]ESO10506.1 hypothetical protein HELRODRAFT_183535 [Helobdella robusta]